MKRLAILLTVLAGFVLSSRADSIPAGPSRVTVSLLTCTPGPDIYTLEGHSALRFTDGGDMDVTVNWGLFDFASPGFVYRFVKGETDYWAGATDTQMFIESYRRGGRGITEQTLALDSATAAKLLELTEVNLRPENRVYRYNYVLDNCATRPLALIERALGDTLTLAEPVTARQGLDTYRRIMAHYHEAYPWYQFGIDLALGRDLDRPVATRAHCFAPVALSEMMAGATLPDGTPAVTATAVLLEETPEGKPLSPTPWWCTPLAVGWLLFGLALLLSVAELLHGGAFALSRLYDTIYYTAVGAAGCVITFLICLSVHYAAETNWLLLWLNPLALLVPVLVWLKNPPRLLYFYQLLNFAALIAMACIWVTGIQGLNQAFVPMLMADMIRAVTYLYTARCPSRKRVRPRTNYYAR